jgi:Domain of unknown function (DUF4157)
MNAQFQTQTRSQAPQTSCFAPLPTRSGLIQRQCACGGTPGPTGECQECRKKRGSLQRKSRNSEPGTGRDSSVPSTVYEVLRSPGQPLDPVARAFMEPRFGHAFSQVSVYHTPRTAFQSQLSVNKPGDVFEQEADRVSKQIVYSSAPPFRPGFDFSSVRVHTDAQAARSARSLNAQAYTVGHEIVRNASRFPLFGARVNRDGLLTPA